MSNEKHLIIFFFYLWVKVLGFYIAPYISSWCMSIRWNKNLINHLISDSPTTEQCRKQWALHSYKVHSGYVSSSLDSTFLCLFAFVFVCFLPVVFVCFVFDFVFDGKARSCPKVVKKIRGKLRRIANEILYFWGDIHYETPSICSPFYENRLWPLH